MYLPAEALRTWLLTQTEVTDLVGEQIAVGRHLFGSDWAIPSNAILLLPSGGTPELYAPLRRNRVYAVCYGTTPWYADAVSAAVIAALKGFRRSYVPTSSGPTAILLDVSQASEIAPAWEPELEVPAVGFYLEAITAEVVT